MSIRDNLGGGSAGSVLDTLEEIEANTEAGKAAGALAVKELNDSLGDISNIGNDTYNSFEKLLRYYIDRGYLPDVKNAPLIPIMTSNTEPSGVASASSIFNTVYDAYMAYSSNTEKGWCPNVNTDSWLMYEFENPVSVSKGYFKNTGPTSISFILQGSNNGSQFTDIVTVSVASNSENTTPFDTTQPYKYYRWYTANPNKDSAGYKFQLYE